MSFTYARFVELVQDALKHLYDSPYLQRHALIRCISEAEPTSPKSQELRRVLLDAIRALRPKSGAPASAADWRVYRILELRYIEGLEPREVMEQVALSKSHYYREQDRALAAVTTILWDRCKHLWLESEDPEGELELNLETSSRQRLAHSEAETLSTHMEWQSVNVVELLTELCSFIAPLAEAKQIQVSLSTSGRSWYRFADRVLLRQALLNVLTFGLDVAMGGKLLVRTDRSGREDYVCICAVLPPDTDDMKGRPEPPRNGVGLEICRRLLGAMGGRLELYQHTETEWEARLLWPPTARDALLVVDNNASFIDLFRRYLARQAWNVLGATSTAEARQILSDLQPAVIVLDVMMPREDGWELLHDLRENAITKQIPVIICSVLNEPDLALTLGANAYLAKPVSQQDLMQALAPWYPETPILATGH